MQLNRCPLCGKKLIAEYTRKYTHAHAIVRGDYEPIVAGEEEPEDTFINLTCEGGHTLEEIREAAELVEREEDEQEDRIVLVQDRPYLEFRYGKSANGYSTVHRRLSFESPWQLSTGSSHSTMDSDPARLVHIDNRVDDTRFHISCSAQVQKLREGMPLGKQTQEDIDELHKRTVRFFFSQLVEYELISVYVEHVRQRGIETGMSRAKDRLSTAISNFVAGEW